LRVAPRSGRIQVDDFPAPPGLEVGKEDRIAPGLALHLHPRAKCLRGVDFDAAVSDASHARRIDRRYDGSDPLHSLTLAACMTGAKAVSRF
jgi:hypothetical protein